MSRAPLKRRWAGIVSAGLLCVGVLVGCGENETVVDPPTPIATPTPKPLDTTVIVPLTVGNRWRYQLVDPSGQQPPTEQIVEVLRDTVLLNEIWFVVSGRDPNGRSPYVPIHSSFYRNSVNGLYEWQEFKRSIAQGKTTYPHIPYPASIGDRFTVVLSLGMGKLVAKQVPVTVPAGDFLCYEFSQDADYSPYPEAVFYFAAGVGLVRSDFYAGDPAPYLREELMEMMLK